MTKAEPSNGGCSERRDLYLFQTAGLLQPDESAALDDHLATGCPRCIGAAAEARAVVESLQTGAESATPPPRVKQALMARVRTDAERTSLAAATGAADDAEPTRVLTYSGWWRSAAAAALAAGLMWVAVVLPMRSEMRGRQRDLGARVAAQQKELERISVQLADAREVANLLRSKSVQLVSMQASDPQPQPQAWGRIVWDKSRGVWQLYTFDLAPAGPDKTYELWFITADERKVPAGTFDIDASGVGSLRVALPDGLGDIALAAITDEPAGGVPQPTGRIQLVGELGT